MGKLKIQPITADEKVLTQTIVDMMGVAPIKAFDPGALFGAMKMFPFSSEIFYDKIQGRWIYTNEPEDYWPDGQTGHNVSGPNFTFIEQEPEMAMIKGIHYYYHTKVKQ